MLDDFQMIVHELDEDLEGINIYPLGDLHIGSENFDEEHWENWINIVKNDPKGYVVMIGDLMDNGLKNSKTNPYRATMPPFEQKRWLADQLYEIRDKILGMCQGNHEHRTQDLVDVCPLYDVCAKIDKEHLYRENMAVLKISLGKKNKDRQWTYSIVLMHGASRNKTDKFSYAIDGMDVFVTGHIHQGSSRFPAKLVIDPRNNNVTRKGFAHVVVPSFASMGGYALRGMYLPQDHTKIPVIKLSGLEKKVRIEWI